MVGATAFGVAAFLDKLVFHDRDLATTLPRAPKNSFLLNNRDGIDLPDKKHYYTDCYETQVFLQDMNVAQKHVITEEELIVRLGNSFINTFPMRFEIWLTGLLTGNKRPPGVFLFHKDDPPLGMWRVEHRSSNEICLRWNLFGREGRTWLNVTGLEKDSYTELYRGVESMHIRFGSGMWPMDYPERKYIRMCSTVWQDTYMRAHIFYSRWLLALTFRVFLEPNRNFGVYMAPERTGQVMDPPPGPDAYYPNVRLDDEDLGIEEEHA